MHYLGTLCYIKAYTLNLNDRLLKANSIKMVNIEFKYPVLRVLHNYGHLKLLIPPKNVTSPVNANHSFLFYNELTVWMSTAVAKQSI